MDMEHKELEQQDDSIVTLTDECGNDTDCEMLDIVEYEGEEFAVLLPCDDEDGEVIILQVVAVDDDIEELLSVDDEERVEAVFEIFKERNRDILDFAE